MKKILLILLAFSFTSYSQWSMKWSSIAINYASTSGFVDYKKSGDKWIKRFYIVDSNKIQIMSSQYSSTPEFTYNFSASERLAGAQIYSIGIDLTGDAITEFYVLGYTGTSTNYQQSFKIINITNGETVFKLENANNSYSYPTFSDVDNDGLYECIVFKYIYPALTEYLCEIYSTNVPVLSVSNNKQTITNFKLHQNYPNPFNPSTNINFSIGERSNVKINFYDVAGKLVKYLDEGTKEKGEHSVKWDGTNFDGKKISSGLYFYEIVTDKYSETKKMILLK